MPLNKQTLATAIRIKLKLESKTVDESVDNIGVNRATVYRALNCESISAENLVSIVEWIGLPFEEFLDKKE